MSFFYILRYLTNVIFAFRLGLRSYFIIWWMSVLIESNINNMDLHLIRWLWGRTLL